MFPAHAFVCFCDRFLSNGSDLSSFPRGNVGVSEPLRILFSAIRIFGVLSNLAFNVDVQQLAKCRLALAFLQRRGAFVFAEFPFGEFAVETVSIPTRLLYGVVWKNSD